MALLRSAARARQLLQPLEQQGSLLRRILGPRLLSSSVPTERQNSLNRRLTDTVERKRLANGKNEDSLQRILMKIDKVSNNLDEHSRLLEELEARIKANNKSREIDLTPAVVLISASFISFGLYKYVLG